MVVRLDISVISRFRTGASQLHRQTITHQKLKIPINRRQTYPRHALLNQLVQLLRGRMSRDILELLKRRLSLAGNFPDLLGCFRGFLLHTSNDSHFGHTVNE